MYKWYLIRNDLDRKLKTNTWVSKEIQRESYTHLKPWNINFYSSNQTSYGLGGMFKITKAKIVLYTEPHFTGHKAQQERNIVCIQQSRWRWLKTYIFTWWRSFLNENREIVVVPTFPDCRINNTTAQQQKICWRSKYFWTIYIPLKNKENCRICLHIEAKRTIIFKARKAVIFVHRFSTKRASFNLPRWPIFKTLSPEHMFTTTMISVTKPH